MKKICSKTTIDHLVTVSLWASNLTVQKFFSTTTIFCQTDLMVLGIKTGIPLSSLKKYIVLFQSFFVTGFVQQTKLPATHFSVWFDLIDHFCTGCMVWPRQSPSNGRRKWLCNGRRPVIGGRWYSADKRERRLFRRRTFWSVGQTKHRQKVGEWQVRCGGSTGRIAAWGAILHWQCVGNVDWHPC